jgi:Spy/CpxP family protein refolding chaperone
MNHLRRLLSCGLAGVLAVGVIGSVIAQETQGENPGPRAGRMHRKGMHLQSLNLTEDQKAKLGAARGAFREKVAGIRTSTTLSQEQKREQFAAARTELRDATRAVLTPEQQQQLQAARANRAGGGIGRRGGFGARTFRRGGQAMSRRLNLTQEQREKLQAASTAFRARAQEVRAMSVPAEEKRALMQQAREAMQAEVRAVLSPEQQQQLQQMRQRRALRRARPAQPAQPARPAPADGSSL